MNQSDIAELFQIMEKKFNTEKAMGVDAIIQFNLTGDFEALYWVEIKDQNATLHEGQAESPKTTFIANAEDYANVVHGKTNAMQAFMQGKLKVKGDMGLAMKLQSIFGL